MFKSISFFILFGLVSFAAYAQKDKPVLVEFLSDDELLVVYNSGLNSVFSVPDLSVLREFSLKDKKNKNAFASLSPKGDRLVVFDSKIKQRVIWNTKTGEKVFSIESNYNSPSVFGGENEFVVGLSKTMNTLSYQIYNLATGDVKGNLDGYELLSGANNNITFSPSGKFMVNYNTSSMDKASFLVFSYPGSTLVMKKDLGYDAEITSVSFNEEETAIQIATRPHMETDDTYWEVSLSNPAVEIKRIDTPATTVSSKLSLDFTTNGFTDGSDIMIPMGSDYSFNNAESDISPSKKWSALANNKGVMVLFDHTQTESTESNGKTYKTPKEVTRITVE